MVLPKTRHRRQRLTMQGRRSTTPPRVGLQVYYDARRINGASAQPAADAAVATWTDLSGNGKDATQATGANQPLYKPTGLASTYPTVLFDGSNDYMASAYTTALTAASIYICGFQTGGSPGSEIFLGETSAGVGRFGIGFDTSTGAKMRFFDGGSPTLDTGTSGPAVPANGVGGVFSLTWASSIAHLRVNNGTVYDSSTANSTVIGDGATWKLGHYDTSTGTFALNGGICALLVYSVAHDDVTRARIERWLGQSFGVTVA